MVLVISSKTNSPATLADQDNRKHHQGELQDEEERVVPGSMLIRGVRRQMVLLPVQITLWFTLIILGMTVYVNSAIQTFFQSDLLEIEKAQMVTRLMPATAEAGSVFQANESHEVNLMAYAERLLKSLPTDNDVAIYDAQYNIRRATPNSRLPLTLSVLASQSDAAESEQVEGMTFQWIDEEQGLLFQPINIDETHLGWLAVHLDLSSQRIIYLQFVRRIYLGFLVTIALIVAVAVLLRSYTRRNIQALLQITKQIGQATWDNELPTTLNGEFRQIGQSVQAMYTNLSLLRDQQQTLLSRISHDIVGPLKTVAITAAMHRGPTTGNDIDNATQQDWDIVYKSVEHVNRLLEDLKFVMRSRIDYVNQRTVPPLDVAATTHEVVDYYRLKYSKSRANFIIEAQSDSPLYLLMERTRFVQVLENLLDNAISHGKATELKINLRQNTIRQIVITVADNGKGIQPEILAHIYEERFSTASDATNPHQGLGLAITSDIVRAHRGKIDVQSELQKGTTFTIRLPAVNIVHTSNNTEQVKGDVAS